MIFFNFKENLSINKTDEKGVIKVTKEEALKYVVAFAVCTVGGLSCEDCPFNGMESCLPLSDEIIHDAVMTLKSDKQLGWKLGWYFIDWSGNWGCTL